MTNKILNPAVLNARERSEANDGAIREAAHAAEVAALNANALHALRAEYDGISYQGSRFGYERSEWRATKRNRGTIKGLDHLGALVIMATNGIVAWYLRPRTDVPGLCQRVAEFPEHVLAMVEQHSSDLTPFLGHVSHFSGDVEPLFSVRKANKTRVSEEPRAKRISKADLYASL